VPSIGEEKEEIQSVLSLDRIIEITEEVFTHFGNGEVEAPRSRHSPSPAKRTSARRWSWQKALEF